MFSSFFRRLKCFFAPVHSSITYLLSVFAAKKNEVYDDRDKARDGIEAQIHLRLESFRSLVASDVMIPKHDIIAVSHKVGLEELYGRFVESALTRILVYAEDSEELIGFVHVKDFLPYAAALGSSPEKARAEFSLKPMIRKAMYLPRSANCLDLLTKMRQAATQVCIVLDEHGAIDGMVMMELLIERIIGDIRDEHDADKLKPLLINKIEDNEYSVQARAAIGAFNELIGRDVFDSEGEYETIGGMIIAYLNRIPAEGEIIEHICGATIEIISADARRVKTVLIKL